MGTVRVGVIGTRWGRMHVGALRAAGAEVVACCGRDPTRTEAVARDEGIALATTDVEVLCRAVDVVVVASPPGAHAEHVRRAWAHGRAVLCEKPLAADADEASALAAEAETAGCPPSAVVFPYRFLPAMVAIEHALVGRAPRHVLVTIRSGFGMPVGDPDHGGATHMIDAALRLVGARPTWVQGSRGTGGLALHVATADGCRLALVQVTAPEPGLHGAWSIIGAGWEIGWSAGYLPALGGWYTGEVRAFDGRAWSTACPAAVPEEGAREPWAEAHVATARAFLARLAGGPPGALATFADAARVQAVLAAAVESERLGRRVALT